MLLIDKYRPNNVDDFLFNRDILEKLMFISSKEDIPHMIFTGPNCSGKETLVDYLLEVLFDSDIKKVNNVRYTITCPSGKKEVFVNQSNYHISFEPTNTNHDKYILQGIISQYATTESFKIFKTNRNFKIFVIRNAENLASNCQYILRRNMELYASKLRIFIICNDLSKLIDPLRSRCQIFCFSTPTMSQIKQVIKKIADSESLTIEKSDMADIFKHCGGNLSKAIWMLECIKFSTEYKLNLEYAYDLLINIIFRKNMTNVCGILTKNLRPHAYDVLITNIKGPELMVTLMNRIIDKIEDEELICKIIQYASVAEYKMVHGRRDIMHIDFFVISVIRLLNQYEKKRAETIVVPKSTSKIKTATAASKNKTKTKTKTKAKSKAKSITVTDTHPKTKSKNSISGSKRAHRSKK